MESLDLYARIEPLIGFYEEYDLLYQRYLKLLQPLHVKSILDIGCGRGRFLELLRDEAYEACGIERSASMLKTAQNIGVEVSQKELYEFPKNSFDVAVAIGDVLNYMKKEELREFFLHVKDVLKDGGYFIADVNSKEGFEIADGVMLNTLENEVLCIEANFEKEVLKTHIEYFYKDISGYTRESGDILQFFHPKSFFKKLDGFSLIKSYYHSMFSSANEKEIMVFQKR